MLNAVLARRLRVGLWGGALSFLVGVGTVWPSLPDGYNCSLEGTSPFTEVGSYLFTLGGAAGAVADLNSNGKADLLLATYSSSLSSISGNFVYTIGWDVDWRTATAASWGTTLHNVSGVVDPGRCDVGAAVGDINANGTPDLVIGTYASVAGVKKFAYRIAWDLDSGGNPATTSALQEADGFDQAFVCSGSGIAIADLDTSGRPELILSAYLGPDGGGRNFRQRILWNLDVAGATAVATTTGNVAGLGRDAAGSDVFVADVDLDGHSDLVLGAHITVDNRNAFRYIVGWNVGANGQPAAWSRWFQFKGVGAGVKGAGFVYAPADKVGPRMVAVGHLHPTGARGRFRYISLPLTTSGAYFGAAQDPPPRLNNVLSVPANSATFTPDRLLNLNMGEVREAAEDALAELLFGCWLAEALAPPAPPVCRYGPPGEATFGSMFTKDGYDQETAPDVLVAAVALYVDSHMSWVEDDANSFVLNTHNTLAYYRGAEHIPAYYTIHFTDPALDPGLITALEAQNPEWALAYNDGRNYHGDCEDHAILRHALLRSLGFGRAWIWDAHSPGHEFNMVLYRGAWRIMDYGPISRYLDRPGSIEAPIRSVWNQLNGPTTPGTTRHLRLDEELLYRVWPDQCATGAGAAFTRYAYPDTR